LTIPAILQSAHPFAGFLLTDADGASVIVGFVDDVVAFPVTRRLIHAHVDVAFQADVASRAAGRGAGALPTAGRARGVFEGLPTMFVHALALGLVAPATALTFEDDGPKARVFALEIGGVFVVFVAKILRVVDLNLTTARILDRLDHLTLSWWQFVDGRAHSLDAFGDHAPAEGLILHRRRHVTLWTVDGLRLLRTRRLADWVSASGAFVSGHVLDFASGIAFCRFFLRTRVTAHAHARATVLHFYRELSSFLALVVVDFGTGVWAAVVSSDAAADVVEVGFHAGLSAIRHFQLLVTRTNFGAVPLVRHVRFDNVKISVVVAVALVVHFIIEVTTTVVVVIVVFTGVAETGYQA